MRIYLADLGHNLVTATSDTYPLGVGNLAAFANAYAKSPKPFDITIYKEPELLLAAIDAAPPDIMGFSTYS